MYFSQNEERVKKTEIGEYFLDKIANYSFLLVTFAQNI